MDIGTQAEIFLREAGYETWAWTGASPPVTCFENAAIVGFVHTFRDGQELLETWEAAQQRVLARYAPALRAAGAKAWNVYSILLSAAPSPDARRLVERLEEDFTLTRKIARVGVQTLEDLANVLMPLSPIKSQPLLVDANVGSRLSTRAKDIPAEALSAFLREATAQDVADILGDKP